MRWSCLWLKCWPGRVPCPCTSSLTSGEPQSHTSVMARKFLPQHHPGPSLLCSGSTREGSPGHDHLRSCPAHRAACAWACLVWWCAERNTTRAAWGRTDFISRQETLSGQIMRKSSSRIILVLNLGRRARMAGQCGSQASPWSSVVQLTRARQVCLGTEGQCLADTWQPVLNEFLPLWYFCWRCNYG